MNISDKIIDEQGPTSTFSSGADSRLIYRSVDGQEKKYLIDGEGGGDLATYEETGDEALIIIESNKFVRYLEPITTIDLQFNKSIKNATVVFEVGTLTSNYIDAYGMLANKPLQFEEGLTYIVTVDNGVIVWNILVEATE